MTKSTMTMRLKIFFLLLVSLSLNSASAETWTVNGNPTSVDIARWARMPPPDSIQVYLGNLAPQIRTLKALFESFGIRHKQIILNDYPKKAYLSDWKTFASLGVELTVLAGIPPSAAEIEVLNQARFKNTAMVLNQFPSEKTVDLLLTIQTSTSYHFIVEYRYPEYTEKFAIARLPMNSTLTFTVTAWPKYLQMDNWNLIPHAKKKLRVLETELNKTDAPYTKNLKNTQEILFQSDGNAGAAHWDFLKEHPIQWELTDKIPDLEDLQYFKNSSSHPRRLVIDRKTLSKSEKERLAESQLEVTWIHPAP